MPNTPIVLSPAVVTVSPTIDTTRASKPVDLESDGAVNAARVLDVTNISGSGGGSIRPISGYIYPRGIG